MFKQSQSDMGMSPTPDGKHLRVAGDIPALLASARTAGARIVVHVTRDNSLLMNSDSTFNITKWEREFDSVATYGNALRQYVKDGTLIGHYAIDEPFIDFKNFQAAYLEDICQYQKQSWPFVPCIVRVNSMKLDSVRSQLPGGVYRYVDAGWAQLTDFAFDKAPFNGDFKMWYDSNLVAGRRSGLGVMYGFNLINGGHEPSPAPDGCAWPPPGVRENCGMTATEIGKVATAISQLGNDQGCGVIGWQLASSGVQRDYFFGTGIYAGNGMPAAMQSLWDSTAGSGLRPGLCSIRGDLPAP
jgi:hypothetical protein